MATTTNTLDHSTLSNLAQAGAVRGAVAVAQPGGWEVVVEYGNTQRALSAKRGEIRLFKKFETLATYMHKLGIDQFRTDVRHFDPASKAVAKRADSSERLREAHAAVAYKKWLSGEIQEAIDDPRPGVPHDQVEADWALERAELLKLVKAV